MSGECAAYLLKLLKVRLDRTYRARAEVFFTGEPFRTQETKAWLLGEESVLSDLIEAFEEKVLSVVEEEESEEPVRHPSVRGPRPHPAG